MTRKKYRYILSGGVKLEDPVRDYRLVSGNNIKSNYWGKTAIRICVDGMPLKKWSCDTYSTTEDKRKIKDLEPVHMIWTGSKWMEYAPDEEKTIQDEIMRKWYIFCEKRVDAQVKNVKENPESYWGKSCSLQLGEALFPVKEDCRAYDGYAYEGMIEFPDGSKYPAASKDPINYKDNIVIESDVKFSEYMLKIKKI